MPSKVGMAAAQQEEENLSMGTKRHCSRALVTSRAYKATCGFLSLTFFLMEFTAYFALKEKKNKSSKDSSKRDGGETSP